MQRDRRTNVDVIMIPIVIFICVQFERSEGVSVVYTVARRDSREHLFCACCSSWLLLNWISSSRSKSCHLCQALLAITTGPYIKKGFQG